jgi:hypothetical protein
MHLSVSSRVNYLAPTLQTLYGTTAHRGWYSSLNSDRCPT